MVAHTHPIRQRAADLANAQESHIRARPFIADDFIDGSATPRTAIALRDLVASMAEAVRLFEAALPPFGLSPPMQAAADALRAFKVPTARDLVDNALISAWMAEECVDKIATFHAELERCGVTFAILHTVEP